MNFTAALEGYWIARRREFSPNTIKDYSRTYDHFAEFVGDKEIEVIDSVVINKFFNHSQKTRNLKDKSLANMWMALSSFWTWAEGELKCPHPMRGKVPCPKYRRPTIEEYSEVEVKAMIASCMENSAWNSRSGKTTRTKRPTGTRDQAIVVTLLETGMRASELCDLRIRDYDQKKGQINIRHGKGDKQRFVYIADSAQRYLWKYMVTRKDVRPDDPLFATTTNRAISRDNLLNMVVATAKRAGVQKANLHKFRHTFATNFLRNGGNLLELKRLLGHESLSTLQIYVELSQADLSRALRTASPADRWRV
jgi:integrase/recombinase XerD